MKVFQQMWERSNERNSTKILTFLPKVASEAEFSTNVRQETLWKWQARTQTCVSRNSRVYFISIHLSTAQQKCNTSLLLFSHFITVHREFHFDVLRIYVMSELKRVWNALLCWGEGNHHFHVCWALITFLNRIPCWCWCCSGAGPGNMLLLLGFRKLEKHVHFWICFFPPAAFGMRFSYILLKWKKQIFAILSYWLHEAHAHLKFSICMGYGEDYRFFLHPTDRILM